MTSLSPVSVARAIRLLEGSVPVTTDGLELTQWYLCLLRQRPTWRAWPQQEHAVVRWPRVPATQLELRLEVAS